MTGGRRVSGARGPSRDLLTATMTLLAGLGRARAVARPCPHAGRRPSGAGAFDP